VKPPDIIEESKTVGQEDTSTKYDELAALAGTHDACKLTQFTFFLFLQYINTMTVASIAEHDVVLLENSWISTGSL
jgi:hypothetical protein